MGQCLSIVAEVRQQVEKAAGDENNENQSPNTDNTSLALHHSVPSGAEEISCKSVYDGDTLTLSDGRRVRLLGIDTPELKEKQPFAEEAKEYTNSRCYRQTLWIYHEPGGEKTDHYGRTLAHVFIKSDGQYLCINEGIVQAGLARFYTPKGVNLHNESTLRQAQASALAAKRGLWRTFVDETVYKTRNGTAYHKKSCEHVSGANLESIKATEGIARGLHPCRTCYE
jgi:endonuclease YncB( thermonuclease family)